MIKKSFPIKKAVAKEKWEPPKKLDGFRGTLVVDPKHPDGIKLTNEHDMYDLYKDDPVRYVEEVKYLFEDGDPPKDRIKKFDGHDSSTFPYNQKKELDIYQKKINNLSPQQKKQLEWNQKKAELAAKVKARVRAHYSKATHQIMRMPTCMKKGFCYSACKSVGIFNFWYQRRCHSGLPSTSR